MSTGTDLGPAGREIRQSVGGSTSSNIGGRLALPQPRPWEPERVYDESEIQLPQCKECSTPLVSGYAWNKAGEEEREEMKADGYQPMWRGGYCRRCFDQPDVSRAAERRRVKGQTVADWKAAGSPAGSSPEFRELANRLGITARGLRRTLLRNGIRFGR